jgi:transcriptional regulator with XRE-family HTH domain
MRLALYCEKNGVTAAELATHLKVSLRTAYRYLSGERIPDREVMPRLVRWSRGGVSPNDFYQNTPRAG